LVPPRPIRISVVRYIGNKTRLLPFILSALDRLGLPPGTVHDAFAGTASVGRALKGAGWRVASSDIMTYSYVLQRAYVVATRAAGFGRVSQHDAAVRRAAKSTRFKTAVEMRGGGSLASFAEYLTKWLEPTSGFITESFAPAGGRMYFTDSNARRIDAVRSTLHEWHEGRLIPDDMYFVLLAALIEGGDRVANTAGVYAAYMKRWQPNAVRPLNLVPEKPLARPAGCAAHLADAADTAKRIGPVDLLYVDPPYNARQYSGYYHVPELIARGWFNGRPRLGGKTGLPGHDKERQQSAWCSRRAAGPSMCELLQATQARHVLVSYNTEGLLVRDELERILSEAAVSGRVERFEKPYRRYRADRDREGRRYSGDSVAELLYYARLKKKR
jgi:adenine-specific DNA-methyltransferase